MIRSLLAVVLCAGCATGPVQQPWERLKVTHADWNPPQGPEWAHAQCLQQASQASGYDWIDSAFAKTEARKNCFKAFGYEE